MNKFKELMNKPMTWGGYLKFTVGCGIVSAVYTIYVYFKIGLLSFEGIKNKINMTKEKKNRKKYFDREE